MGMSCNAHLYVLVEKGRGGESKNNMGILAHVFGRTSLGTTSQHTHVPSAMQYYLELHVAYFYLARCAALLVG